MPGSTLVCFAVELEAWPFRQLTRGLGQWEVLVTGMGPIRAQRTSTIAVKLRRPRQVFTCGFAGGLNPALALGDVIFETDADNPMSARLIAAGAKPARFHSAKTVAATAAAKQELWKTTGADAVEMESYLIRALCQEQRIPSATVRVISDPASEDLPLDFNQCLTPDYAIAPSKLALLLLKCPQRVPALLRFQQRCRNAAQQLARVLWRLQDD